MEGGLGNKYDNWSINTTPDIVERSKVPGGQRSEGERASRGTGDQRNRVGRESVFAKVGAIPH